jgi:hypothetical protein
MIVIPLIIVILPDSEDAHFCYGHKTLLMFLHKIGVSEQQKLQITSPVFTV